MVLLRPRPDASRPARIPRPVRLPRPTVRGTLPWLALTAVSAAVAILFAYQVSLSPLGLHPRSVVFATAENQVLIDNQPSAVVYDGHNGFVEKEHEIYDPAEAVLLSQYLLTQGPLQQMARAAGIPGQIVSASGPFTTTLDEVRLNIPAVGPQVGAAPGTNKRFRLLVDVDGVRPMLTLYGQAPTLRAAEAIVNTARAQLVAFVAREGRSAKLGPAKRLVLRPLGPTVGAVVDPGAKTTLLVMVFALSFVIGGIVIVALRRRAWWRRFPVGIREQAAIDVDGGPIDDNLDIWPHTRRFLPWSMAAFMVMLFLVPIDAILASGNAQGPFPIAPTLDRVLLTIVGIGWLLKFRSWRRIPVRLNRIHGIVFLFIAVCFLGLAVNGLQLAEFQEVMPTAKKLVLLVTFGSFFYFVSDIIRPGEVRPLLNLMVGLGVLCALGTIIERGTRNNLFYDVWNGVLPMTRPPEMDVLDDIGRLGVVGPTSEPLELATLLAIVMPFAIIFALEAKGRWDRLWYITATAVLMAGAVATSRKTSFVCPAVGLIVLIAYRPKAMMRAILIAIVPLFIAIHLLAPGQIGTVFTQLLPSHATTVNTDKVRVQRYDAVRPDIMSHLVLGRGFQSYDPIKYRYLDNEYLGLLIGAGVLGTVIFLGIFFAVFSYTHPLIRGPDRERASIALALQSAMTMIMVACALFDLLSFEHVSYMLFFLSGLLIAMRKPVRQLDVPRTVATPAAVRPAPGPRRIGERSAERPEGELQPV